MNNGEAGYALIFIFRLFIRGHYLLYKFVRAPSANCEHAAAIALTRPAICKIYFGINLLASFREPGPFTQNN